MTPEQMSQMVAGVPVVILGMVAMVGILVFGMTWGLHDKSEEIIETRGYTEDSIQDAASTKATGTLLLIGGVLVMAVLLSIGGKQ